MLAKADFYFLIFKHSFFSPMNYEMGIFNILNYHFKQVQKML